MIIDNLNKRKEYKNDITGLQYVALEILKEFDRICRKNNIEYWITDGTLLGAVRHRGFIPWDDDIDVCIKSEDEEKLSKIMKEELPYYLYFCSKDKLKFQTNFNFCKLKDRYSYVKEPIEAKDNQGIWIDIFPMTSVKENKLIYYIINYIVKYIPKERFHPNDSAVKKIIRVFIYKILGIFNLKTRESIFNKFYKTIAEKKEKDSLIYMHGQEWWHTYKKKWIFPLKEIEFEGHKFFCPNDSNKYLESYYGKNYMEIPPENKRITHSIEIDLFNSRNYPESLKWSEREKHIKEYIGKIK